MTASCEPGRAPDRSTGARPPRSPSTVTDTTHCGLLTRSPPTIPASNRPASYHIPSASALTWAAERFRRRTEADDKCGHPRAHRLDVGGVLRHGFTANVMRRRPVQPKVATFHEHVGGYHHPAVGGRYHRAVVAGPDNHIARRGPAAGQSVDHLELTDLAERAI